MIGKGINYPAIMTVECTLIVFRYFRFAIFNALLFSVFATSASANPSGGAKYHVYEIPIALPVDQPSSPVQKKLGLAILVYHQFRSGRQEPWDESITVSLREFEAQMRYLHDAGYTTLNMNDVVDFLAGKPFPNNVVAIHLDDGWKSAKDAVPVLNRYGFKASFWIIAGAGHDHGSPHMNWDEIIALSRNKNFDVYSHTMTHPWKAGDTLADWSAGLTPGRDQKDALWELKESKRQIEEKLGHLITFLAWPKGIYNGSLVKLAKEVGYTALVTIDSGFNYPGDSPFYIKRIMVDGRCDFKIFLESLHDGLARHCQIDSKSGD